MIDLNDPNAVADHADDIFLGTVASAGDVVVTDGPVPTSTFTVKVEKLIKGDVSGSVEVTQEGGLNKKENTVYKYGGDALLKVGETYLFATKGARNLVVPIAGDQLISSTAQSKQLASVFTEAVS